MGWEGFAPLSPSSLFKGQLYTLNTIMKYKQGKLKNTFLLERKEADKPPESHLIVAFSSPSISYYYTMSYSSTVLLVSLPQPGVWLDQEIPGTSLVDWPPWHRKLLGQQTWLGGRQGPYPVIFTRIFLTVLTKIRFLSTWALEKCENILKGEKVQNLSAEVWVGFCWAVDRCLSQWTAREGGWCGLESWCPPQACPHSQGPSEAEAMRLCSHLLWDRCPSTSGPENGFISRPGRRWSGRLIKTARIPAPVRMQRPRDWLTMRAGEGKELASAIPMPGSA